MISSESGQVDKPYIDDLRAREDKASLAKRILLDVLGGLKTSYDPGSDHNVETAIYDLADYVLVTSAPGTSDEEIIAELQTFYNEGWNRHYYGLSAEITIALARHGRLSAAEMLVNTRLAKQHIPQALLAIAEGYALHRYDLETSMQFIDRAHYVSSGLKPEHWPYLVKALDARAFARSEEGVKRKNMQVLGSVYGRDSLL
jgi:hypothetical protein